MSWNINLNKLLHYFICDKDSCDFSRDECIRWKGYIEHMLSCDSYHGCDTKCKYVKKIIIHLIIDVRKRNHCKMCYPSMERYMKESTLYYKAHPDDYTWRTHGVEARLRAIKRLDNIYRPLNRYSNAFVARDMYSNVVDFCYSIAHTQAQFDRMITILGGYVLNAILIHCKMSIKEHTGCSICFRDDTHLRSSVLLGHICVNNILSYQCKTCISSSTKNTTFTCPICRRAMKKDSFVTFSKASKISKMDHQLKLKIIG